MKKKILIILSALILVAGATILLVVLLKEDEPVEEPPIQEVELIQLKKPLALSIDGFDLSWDKVENASSYLVYVDDMEYEVLDNSFNLSNVVEEGSVLSVKAIGRDKYKNSVKSIELIFRSVIDENEVQIIKNELNRLINKYLVITNDISNILDSMATKMFMNGLSSIDAVELFAKIDNLLQCNQDIIQLDKLSTLKTIFSEFVDIINLNINEFACISGFFIFFELYCEVYKKNQSKLELTLFDTIYFENGEVLSNFDALLNMIKNLKSVDIQYFASLLKYYNVYYKQINNIKNTFEKIDVENINEVYNEVLTLKNLLCDLLLNQMPLVVEFEGFKKVFFNMYNILSDGYLEDKLTQTELESYFNNLYTINEYYLSFLNALEESDYKVIVSRGLSFYKSFSEEDKQNIKDVIDLIDLDSENNIFKIIEKHFVLNFGDYDFEIDESFKQNINNMLSDDDLYQFLKNLLDYLEFGKFISSNEEILNLVIEYIIELIPEHLQNTEVFSEYIIEIFNKLDYEDYVSINLEKLFKEEDRQKIVEYLIDTLTGKLEYEEFISKTVELIDYESTISIDYDAFFKDLIDNLKVQTIDLALFLEEVIHLEVLNIQNILEIMNIDAVLDIDMNGFVEHVLELMDITVEKEITFERVENFVMDTQEEVESIIGKLDKYVSLIDFFRNSGDQEYTEEDIEDIYSEESLDFVGLFILIDHLNVKYARFQVHHNPVYEDGLEFNLDNFEENLFNCIVYLYYGIHSYAGHDVTIDGIRVAEKLIEIAKDYQQLLDIKEHYENLFNEVKEIEDLSKLSIIYQDEAEFNRIIEKSRSEIDYAYNSINYLTESLPFEELIKLDYSLVKLVESYGYKNISNELIKVVELIDDSYDEFLSSVDEVYQEYAVKEQALISLYSNVHTLFDPIEEYVLELKDQYYSDLELSDDDIIDIVSSVLMNKNRVNEFYKKDVILNVGENLDVLFGDRLIDFNEGALEVIFYGDFIYNRINAHNVVSTALDLTRKLLDIIVIVEECDLIFQEITNVLDDTSFSYEEKTIRYAQLYLDLTNKYDEIKASSMTFVVKLDQFMLKGIEELSKENIEYENRKEEFLFEEDFVKMFDILDEIISKLDVELPEKSDLNLTDLIVTILKDMEVIKK